MFRWSYANSPYCGGWVYRQHSTNFESRYHITAWHRLKNKRVTSQVTSGADIAIQSLVNHNVDTIFAYPGGYTIPLHQALTRFRDKIRVILPRHEQGCGFGAQGYARFDRQGRRLYGHQRAGRD